MSKDQEATLTELAKQLGEAELAGPVDKALAISFNCPAGWDAVSAHVDGCLKRQGYTEKGMNPALQRAASRDTRIAKALGSQRMYTKSGEKCLVLIQDATAGGLVPAPQGMGSFMLSVFRFK